MKIVFTRHGQTTGDIEDRYGGDYDDHLTEEGRKQAQELAHELQEKNIKLIVSSPLARARECATILSGGAIPIQINQNFKECNHYGILSGLTKSEAKARYPKLAEQVKNRLNTIEGAESYDDFFTRLNEGLKQVISDNQHRSIAIVSHGGPIRAIIRDILGKGEINYYDNCWLELESTPNGLKLLDSRRIDFLS